MSSPPFDPFAPSPPGYPHGPALRALSSADARLAALISHVGPCPLGVPAEPTPGHEHFTGLVRVIVSQQLSSKAADTIFGRVRALVPGDAFPDPARLLAVPEPRLREAGLSGAKARYVRDLAARVHEGHLRLDDLHALDDEAVIETLCAVKGLGRWSAEMFLMFRLGRPDILPVADLGIQKGFETLFGLRKRPTAERMTKLARSFRPHRSIVCWYLWRLGDLPAEDVKRIARKR
jgi:DNA-3-methyladenine glycosylase II